MPGPGVQQSLPGRRRHDALEFGSLLCLEVEAVPVRVGRTGPWALWCHYVLCAVKLVEGTPPITKMSTPAAAGTAARRGRYRHSPTVPAQPQTVAVAAL